MQLDGPTLILAIIGAYVLLAAGVLGWPPGACAVPARCECTPHFPAVMLVASLALLTVWAIRADWLGIISSGLMATSFAKSLRTALARRGAG